jgi:hypothetical protein
VLEVAAHDLSLFFEPAGANAKNKAAVGKAIQGGNHFGQHQRIALRHQANTRAQLDRGGDGGRLSQSDKGVRHVAHRGGYGSIRTAPITARRVHGDDRMFWQPQGLKPQRLCLLR